MPKVILQIVILTGGVWGWKTRLKLVVLLLISWLGLSSEARRD